MADPNDIRAGGAYVEIYTRDNSADGLARSTETLRNAAQAAESLSNVAAPVAEYTTYALLLKTIHGYWVQIVALGARALAGASAAVPYVAAIAAAVATVYVGVKAVGLAWDVVTGAIRAAVNLTTAMVTGTARLAANITTAVGRGIVAGAEAGWNVFVAMGRAAIATVAGGASIAARVGSAIASITDATLQAARRTYEQVSAFTQAVLDRVEYVGSRMVSIGRSITAPLTDAANKFGDAGEAAEKLASRAGISTRSMMELGYAARQAGSSAGDVADAIKEANDSVTAANKSAGEHREMLNKLGISMASIFYLNPEERFLKIGHAISELASEEDRAAAASVLFGTSSESLLKMFAAGPAGLRQTRQEAERLGLVLDGPAAKAGKALAESYAKIRDASLGLAIQIGAAVAPRIAQWNDLVVAALTAATNWVKANQPVVTMLFRVADAAVSAGTAMVTLSSGIIPAIPKLLTLAAAAFAASSAWERFGPAVMRAIQPAIDTLRFLWDETKRVVDGIENAIRAGDIEFAVQIAWEGARLAWMRGLLSIAELMPDWMAGILEALAVGEWGSAIDQIVLTVQIGFSHLEDIFDVTWEWIKATTDKGITYLRQGWNSVVSDVINQIRKLQSLMTSVAAYDPTGAASKVAEEVNVALNKAISGELFTDSLNAAESAARRAVQIAADYAEKIRAGTATDEDKAKVDAATQEKEKAFERLSDRERVLAERNAKLEQERVARQEARDEETARRRQRRAMEEGELYDRRERERGRLGVSDRKTSLEQKLADSLAAAADARIQAEGWFADNIEGPKKLQAIGGAGAAKEFQQMLFGSFSAEAVRGMGISDGKDRTAELLDVQKQIKTVQDSLLTVNNAMAANIARLVASGFGP
jgi:hypothetical protein